MRIWLIGLAATGLGLGATALAELAPDDPAALYMMWREDGRIVDSEMRELLLHDERADVRARAALAVGRIGRVSDVPALARALADPAPEVRRMAAFALGEIADSTAADPIVDTLSGETEPAVRELMVEALGKLRRGAEACRGALFDPAVEVRVRALLAAWQIPVPGAADRAIALAGSEDAHERWAATYCLMRLLGAPASGRTPIAAVDPLDDVTSERIRGALLQRLADPDPEIRLVAARGLRTVADPEVTRALLDREDPDWRVRVEILRALGDGGAGGRALDVADLTPYFEDEHELVALTAIGALGRVGGEADATRHLLGGLRAADPRRVTASFRALLARWSADSTFAGDPERVEQLERLTHYVLGRDEWTLQVLAVEALPLLPEDRRRPFTDELVTRDPRVVKLAVPAAFEAAEAETFLERARPLVDALVDHDDVTVHFMTWNAVAEHAYGDTTGVVTESDLEQVDAWLAEAYARWSTPAGSDLRQTVVDAFGLNPERPAAKRALERALSDPSHLVRRAAAIALGLPADAPPVTPVASLSAPSDYAHIARWSGGPHWAVVATDAGRMVARLHSRDAPMTAWNFARLANAGFYDEGTWHRVVADFVLQNGCPRGDGWGGPDWAIRCEINEQRYVTGALGMALSGKDTGGSQYFFTHSAQPHLDGGYTVFGQLDDSDLEVANRVLQGDSIQWVRVVDTHPDEWPQ